MARNFLFLSLLLSFIVNTVSAQTVSLTQNTAFAIVRNYYAGKDVDYYICRDYPNGWQFFVDEEPLKSWEHDCCVYTFVNSPGQSFPVPPIKQKFRLPPDINLTPLAVRNRYGVNATVKPDVAATTDTNSQNEVAQNTYAVIISGGVNKNSNYERYWNDCSFIYQTLVRRYNIPRSNINVIMSDGTDPAADMRTVYGGYASSPLDLDSDGTNDIQYSATLSNIQTVLNSLSTELKEDDHLFIFVTDHGGTADNDASSYINLWGGEKLFDYTLAGWLTPFINNYVNVNVVLGQCFSGGFIDNLTKAGCVVATACSGSEYSWSCSDRPYDEFVYQWMSAINKANTFGTVISSDTDNNGRVTMEEAFAYAKKNDRANESPQYVSTPISVGEDLAFNNSASAVDLYIKDNDEDTGKEPNLTTDAFWRSPDVWVRNIDDGIEVHENPYYSNDHPAAVIYVKIYNRGKKDYDGNGNLWAHVYWTKAATGITVKTWKGRELYNNEFITGEHLRAVKIPEIPAGGSSTVKVTWSLPFDMLGTEEDNGTEKHHFCLIARIMDTYLDDAYDPTSYNYFNVSGENDIAQKNVSIISRIEASQSTSVFVRNMENKPHSYSLEIHPLKESDAQIFTKAKVEMTMSRPILRAWQRGGYQCKSLSYSPSADSLKVMFTSRESRLENISLNGDEFEKVSLKFDFHAASPLGTTYSFDLIQRDEDGNIVGGETFIVEAPVFRIINPVVITPIEIGDGRIRLEANLDGTEQLTKWTDAKGTVISDSNSVTVSPTLNNNTYSLKVLNADGELTNESITLEPADGIKSARPSTSVNGYIDVELDNEVSSSNSLISVNHATNGLTVLNVPIPLGSKIVRIDTSSLPSGMYILSYIVNGLVTDTLKFSKQ